VPIIALFVERTFIYLNASSRRRADVASWLLALANVKLRCGDRFPASDGASGVSTFSEYLRADQAESKLVFVVDQVPRKVKLAKASMSSSRCIIDVEQVTGLGSASQTGSKTQSMKSLGLALGMVVDGFGVAVKRFVTHYKR